MPFDPSTIAGMQMWLKPDGGSTFYQDTALTIPVTADGQLIGGWKDSYTSNNNCTTVTGISREPTYKTNIVNGFPVARFGAGGSTFLENAGFTLNQPLTVFVVGKWTSGTAQAYFTGGLDVAPGASLLVSGSTHWYATADGGSTVLGNTTTTDTSWHYFTTVFNGGSSAVRLDGAALYSGAAGTNNDTRFVVGALRVSGGSNSNFNGDIAEVLVYNTALGSTDYGNVEGYLNAKYFAAPGRLARSGSDLAGLGGVGQPAFNPSLSGV